MGKTAYLITLNGPQVATSAMIVYASFGWGVVFMERYRKRLIEHKPAILLQAACKKLGSSCMSAILRHQTDLVKEKYRLSRKMPMDLPSHAIEHLATMLHLKWPCPKRKVDYLYSEKQIPI